MRLLIAALVLGLGTAGALAQGNKTDSRTSWLKSKPHKVSASVAPNSGKLNSSPNTTQQKPVQGKDFIFTLDSSGMDPIPPVVMKWIPAGEFQMGSSRLTDLDRTGDEIPHRVKLSGFWLMETEVTQEIYWAVMRGKPSKFSDPKNPVESVNHVEATDFCKTINSILGQSHNLTGFEFRLPTEAEWEYACRAGTTTAVYVNYRDRKAELDEIAWWKGNSGNAPRHVKALGKLPNAWGLYDMIGNVWEWCSDGYADYSGQFETDPKGSDTAPHRVNRGGSWRSEGSEVRSANRNSDSPGWRNDDLGFRAALGVVR